MRALTPLLFALPPLLALPGPRQEAHAPTPVEPTTTEALLPEPEGSVRIDPSIDGSLRSALGQVAASAGVNLALSPGTEELLNSGASLLQAPVVVPASEAWSFIESLMAECGLVISLHRTNAPRLISVHRAAGDRDGALQPVPTVLEAGELEQFENHPALYVTAVVPTQNVDPRNLANSMRGLAVDSRLFAMLPAGDSSSVILTGSVSSVRHMASTVELVDSAAGEQRARWDAERAASAEAQIEANPGN